MTSTLIIFVLLIGSLSQVSATCATESFSLQNGQWWKQQGPSGAAGTVSAIIEGDGCMDWYCDGQHVAQTCEGLHAAYCPAGQKMSIQSSGSGTSSGVVMIGQSSFGGACTQYNWQASQSQGTTIPAASGKVNIAVVTQGQCVYYYCGTKAKEVACSGQGNGFFCSPGEKMVIYGHSNNYSVGFAYQGYYQGDDVQVQGPAFVSDQNL